MNVWLLVHDYDDYTSDREVIGVFASEDAAQRSLTVKAGRHDTSCCSVEEWDVETRERSPFLGPFEHERIMDPVATFGSVIPVAEPLLAYLTKPVPLLWHDRPIGRITKVTETDDGITFEAELL